MALNTNITSIILMVCNPTKTAYLLLFFKMKKKNSTTGIIMWDNNLGKNKKA